MNETWKDVIDSNGLYQVSDLGRVRSLRDGKVRILKPRFNNCGYLRVRLYRNGKMKDNYVHRLVAEAFIPNPSNLPQVNHKDEDKTNNSADNLEWCTAEYNMNYGSGRARKFLQKAILQYDDKGNLVKEWVSASEVERQMGFPQSSISKCCRGKLKSTHGYIWKFK